MIKLSNGHDIEYMAASGSLGFDGQGWLWEKPFRRLGLLDPGMFTVVIKTLTLEPNKGNWKWHNPLYCIRPLKHGMLNAFALSNPGVFFWKEKIAPRIDFGRYPIVGSMAGSMDELAAMTRIFNGFELAAIEINDSCPNVCFASRDTWQSTVENCRAVKKISNKPLILKISVTHDLRILDDLGEIIEAISINTIPWSYAYPGKRSPLERLGGGGISGKAAQPFTWELAKRITKMTDIPVIWPSVWDYDDMSKLRLMGAKAVSFGSIFLRYPWRPSSFIKKIQKAA